MQRIIFQSYLPLEMMYQYILFQIFHKLSLFLFSADAYAMQEGSHTSHLWKENPTHWAIWLKFRLSFTKSLRNLIMISICEKVKLQQARKAKYSILASILNIFQNFKSFQNLHTYLYKTMCTSHGFLISCFELETFFKKYHFLKNSFCHSFWNKILFLILCMMIADHDILWLTEPDFWKKNLGGPNLRQMSKIGLKARFFYYYLKFGSLVSLDIAYNDSSQQCLTCSWGKIHEKKLWDPNLGQRNQNRSQN